MGCEFLCSTFLCVGLGLLLYFSDRARKQAKESPPEDAGK